MSPDADYLAKSDHDAAVREMAPSSDSAKDAEAAHAATSEKEAQAGVQMIEAIATVWSTKTLITAYVMIWIVYFVMLVLQGATTALTPYVTSSFALHSLTPTVGIVSYVVGGVTNLAVAKILDIFGRPQGYGASLLVVTVGIVMMAATTSVQMYAAANVFWTVGIGALLYTVNILVADTTSLQNRGLMTALTASPNIITTWLGGPISEAFLDGPGWEWCFGAFSIIVPVLGAPLLVLLVLNYRRAKTQGLVAKPEETRSVLSTLVYYCREFDAVGLILVAGGLAMFLLPFNLYLYQDDGWESPMIICLLVFGVVLIIGFVFWERFLAPVTFIPYTLLLDRNMVGGCVLGFVLFISVNCWVSLFESSLQVVNGLSVTEANYVSQIYSVGSSLFTIAAGVIIRYTGRFKAITLYGAIPIYVLFMGLRIYFLGPDWNIGYTIMCQIFMSFAAGIMIITPQIAAMSAASHQDIAVVLAILSMFSYIGGAVGFTVAGAIWQGIFPVKLAEYLPVEELENLLFIYGSLDIQLSYPVGSAARIAIQQAYEDAQTMMLVAGTAIWAVGVVAVAIWRNTDVRTIKQVEGHVI